MPEFIISCVLGHKQPDTTASYMRIAARELTAITGKNHCDEPQITVTDSASYEAYLQSLDKEGLNQAMNAMYKRMMAGT